MAETLRCDPTPQPTPIGAGGRPMLRIDELIDGRDDPIVVADHGAVRFVILNRPAARNALTRAMRRDFAALLARANVDPAVAALVLTGGGPAFGAGVDLRERAAGAPQPPIEPNPGRALRALSKPCIAAVDGACVTGALEMALSCDFVIASDRARFADTHVAVGLFPRWGQGSLLTEAIGVRRARQMMLTGTFVDAPTALAWGLVNEIVPQATLIDRAYALASAMAEAAASQPGSFALHATMLARINAARSAEAATIERSLLDRFDARPALHCL